MDWFPSPHGVFLTTHTVLKNRHSFLIAYLNGDMTMINGSRSGLVPLKLWWIVRKNGMEGFTGQAANIIESARYLQKRLGEQVSSGATRFLRHHRPIHQRSAIGNASEKRQDDYLPIERKRKWSG